MNIARLSEQLKDIPQQKLVQYAQDPAGVVPQFLALAEIQRRKKLELSNPGQPPQSTVAQDIMAQAVQPSGIGMPQPRTGVAALPSNMGEQSFAGGGIVAFAGDEDSYVEDPDSLSFQEKLLRLRSGKKEDRQPSLFERGMEGLRRLPEKFSALGAPARTAGGVYGGDVDTQLGYTPSRPVTPAPTIAEEKASKPAATKTSEKTAPSAPEVKDPQKKLFEDYEKMLMAQGEDAKKAREEAKYMRLLEAGLGIMGGTSPYAAANIGAGATGALKGYAQDVAGMRKEERERAKELASIGAKREEFAIDREKLGMLERRYKEMADIERQKIGAMYGGREDEKFISQVNRVYQTDISALKNQLGRELTDEELNSIYRNAYNRVASVAGKGSMPGAPAAGGTIYDWNQLGKKAK